jgi:hypothetical protein
VYRGETVSLRVQMVKALIRVPQRTRTAAEASATRSHAAGGAQTKYTKKPPKGMSDSLKDVELALAELKDVTEVDRSYRGAAGKLPRLSLSSIRVGPCATAD